MNDIKTQNINALDSSLTKTCAACGTTFDGVHEFWQRTSPLATGAYSQGPKNSVLVYRNCQCGSTLTWKLKDRRDYSDNGVEMRLKFRQSFERWLQEGKSKLEAEKLTRKEMGLKLAPK